MAEIGINPPVVEKSGAQWVSRFPGSRSIVDLKPPFQLSVARFIDALNHAGASHQITATYRPPERAYLMHFSYEIAKKNLDPQLVPAMQGVNIAWWHGNKTSSINGAAAMVAGYGTVSPGAVLMSNHTLGHAVDMNISWALAALKIYDAQGNLVIIDTGTKDGQNPKLHAVGKTYGVIKLVSDRPHWSINGH